MQLTTEQRNIPAATTRAKLNAWNMPIKTVLATIFLIMILLGYFVVPTQLERFKINTVKIHGQLTITPRQEICDLITKLITKGFFATNVNTVRAALQQLPWIATAQVEKIWPDKISLLLTEKQPLAKWRGKGIITTSGEVIYAGIAEHDLAKLPIFWGADHQNKKMLVNYLLISRTLKDQHLAVQELEILPDNCLKATLNNGMMLIAHEDGLLEKLNRFNLAYRNKLQKIVATISYVDLRYVNGISVGLKDNIDGNTKKAS